MNIAIVGLGYWGPNLARNLKQLDVLSAVVDKDPSKVEKFRNDPIYCNVKTSTSYEDSVFNSDVEAVVVATPPNTHYTIAKACLENGRHVFVEKPMTLRVDQSEELVKIANKNKLILMVGHTFLYSPDIIKMKELVQAEEFGNLYYMYSRRLNLGKIQSPANVIEDLAPHDIAIFNFISGKKCVAAQAFGTGCILDYSADIAFVNLRYEDGIIANLHLSWLDPFKIRDTVMVGSKQMIYCDSGTKELRIYNKGVDLQKQEDEASGSYSKHLLTYRYGDMITPYIDTYEPLRAEMEAFIFAIRSGKSPVSDGYMGLEVVKVLAAAQKSLRGKGEWIEI